jgi:hypothetical protein
MIDCKIYENGDTFSVTLTVENLSQVDAQEVEVAITNTVGVVLDSEQLNGIGSVVNNTSILNTWQIPVVFGGQKLAATFTYAITDSSKAPWTVSCIVSTTTREVNLGNNNASVNVDPLTDYKIQLASDTADFEIPSSVFTDPLNPLISEVNTWVDNNLTLETGEEVILYMQEPFIEENVTYEYPAGLVYRTGISGNNITLETVTIDGLQYPLLSIPWTDSNGQYVGVKADIESALEVAFGQAGYNNVYVEYREVRYNAQSTTEYIAEKFVLVVRQTEGTNPISIQVNFNDGDTNTLTLTPVAIPTNINTYTTSNIKDHIWRYQKGSTTVKTFSRENNGNILYVSRQSDNSIAQIGNPNRAFSNPWAAMNAANYTVV